MRPPSVLDYVLVRGSGACVASDRAIRHQRSYTISPDGQIQADNTFTLDKAIPDLPRLGVSNVNSRGTPPALSLAEGQRAYGNHDWRAGRRHFDSSWYGGIYRWAKAAQTVEWDLRLYVAGQDPRSTAAFRNLTKFCEEQWPLISHRGDRAGAKSSARARRPDSRLANAGPETACTDPQSHRRLVQYRAAPRGSRPSSSGSESACQPIVKVWRGKALTGESREPERGSQAAAIGSRGQTGRPWRGNRRPDGRTCPRGSDDCAYLQKGQTARDSGCPG